MPNVFDVRTPARGRSSRAVRPCSFRSTRSSTHGPHLSLHNDALVSQGLAREIHAELTRGGKDWPLLLATDLEIGVDPTPGLGSRSTSYRDACGAVVNACRALVELGAQRVVLITFHGSPLHSLAIDAGVRWLGRHGVPALSPLNLLLRAMLDVRIEDYADAYATITDPGDRAALMREGPFDLHAGFQRPRSRSTTRPTRLTRSTRRSRRVPTSSPTRSSLRRAGPRIGLARESSPRSCALPRSGLGGTRSGPSRAIRRARAMRRARRAPSSRATWWPTSRRRPRASSRTESRRLVRSCRGLAPSRSAARSDPRGSRLTRSLGSTSQLSRRERNA